MTKIFTKEENQAWAKKLPGKMCSACLILRASDKVLMVKAEYKDHWTFPSGIVDEKESPKMSALRETKEEVGLDIQDDNCSFFTVVYTSAKDEDDRDRFNFAFITDVDDLNIGLAVPNDEITEAKWVDFDQVAELSRNKGSYIELQNRLLDPGRFIPYVEI